MYALVFSSHIMDECISFIYHGCGLYCFLDLKWISALVFPWCIIHASHSAWSVSDVSFGVTLIYDLWMPKCFLDLSLTCTFFFFYLTCMYALFLNSFINHRPTPASFFHLSKINILLWMYDSVFLDLYVLVFPWFIT